HPPVHAVQQPGDEHGDAGVGVVAGVGRDDRVEAGEQAAGREQVGQQVDAARPGPCGVRGLAHPDGSAATAAQCKRPPPLAARWRRCYQGRDGAAAGATGACPCASPSLFPACCCCRPPAWPRASCTSGPTPRASPTTPTSRRPTSSRTRPARYRAAPPPSRWPGSRPPRKARTAGWCARTSPRWRARATSAWTWTATAGPDAARAVRGVRHALQRLAVAAAVIWWWAPEWLPAEWRAALKRDPRDDPASREYAPVVYRWRDADGVLHVTDKPPGDRD